MPKFFSKTILLALFILGFVKINAQVSVTAGYTAAQLAKMLAGPGVAVSNATLNGSCDSLQRGKFFVTSSNLSMDSGIILTSGSAIDAVGPSGVPSTSWGAVGAGDTDLAILTAPSKSWDACVLELDFIPTGDTIKFKYVFGSAEYQSFTCLSYSDAFGFFISGPGITGPFTNNAKNIALLPNGCFVGINTVNSHTVTPCGTVGAPCAPPNNALFYSNLPTGNTTTGIAYNGYTLPMYAIAVVQPCSTYHLKLAISDGQDHYLDSGVFLEAGSLSSNNISLNFNTGIGAGNPFIVEGCDSLILKIKRNLKGATIVRKDTINIGISGTATNGVDFNTIPSQVYFTDSLTDTLQTIIVHPYADGITETGEYVTIKLMTGCNNTAYDSITITIKDSLSFMFGNTNKAICLGDSVITSGVGYNGMTFTWTPTIGVANPNSINTSIKPLVGVKTYTVASHYLGCPPAIKSFTITTDTIPYINLASNYSVCNGSTVQMNATIVSPTALTYNWNPTNNLLNANTLNPIFNGTSSQNITLTAITNNAFCTTTVNTHVTVFNIANGYTNITDTLVCSGFNVQLQAYGGLNNYFWYPNSFISCTTCPNPIVNPTSSTVYYVVYLEPHGCQDTSSVDIQIDPPFTLALVNHDTTIEAGTPILLNAYGAFGYSWSPNYNLTVSNAGMTYASPLLETTYTIIGVDSFYTCPQQLTLNIKVFEDSVTMPNAFTPNGDGMNDKFYISNKRYMKLQSFKIFNRWGNEVFSGKSIEDGWDGTFKGKACDTDTYYYFARWGYPSGKVKDIKGEVILIR